MKKVDSRLTSHLAGGNGHKAGGRDLAPTQAASKMDPRYCPAHEVGDVRVVGGLGGNALEVCARGIFVIPSARLPFLLMLTKRSNCLRTTEMSRPLSASLSATSPEFTLLHPRQRSGGAENWEHQGCGFAAEGGGGLCWRGAYFLEVAQRLLRYEGPSLNTARSHVLLSPFALASLTSASSKSSAARLVCADGILRESPAWGRTPVEHCLAVL